MIGCPYNLTGGYASIDNPAKHGSRAGGEAAQRRPTASSAARCELVIDDGKSDLTAITNITKKMVDEDKVIALVGLTDTDYMRAGGSIAQENGIPFLDVGGTAPIIETIGDLHLHAPLRRQRPGRGRCRVRPGEGLEDLRPALRQGDDLHPVPRPVLQGPLHRRRDPGSRSSPSCSTRWATPISRPNSPSSRTSTPRRISSSSPPNPGEIGTIIKQARDLGIEQPIMGGDGYDTPLLLELAGDAARNVYFTTHQGIYGDAPEAKDFAAKYETEYGNAAAESVFAALGFDGINLMADAINRAGDTRRREDPRRARRHRRASRAPPARSPTRPRVADPLQVRRPDRGQGRQVQPDRDRRAADGAGGVVWTRFGW